MTKLKELRLKFGYTQQEIADILGIVQATYSLHELGKSLLNSNQIKTLSLLYKVSTDEILDMQNEDQFREIQKKLADFLTSK